MKTERKIEYVVKRVLSTGQWAVVTGLGVESKEQSVEMRDSFRNKYSTLSFQAVKITTTTTEEILEG